MILKEFKDIILSANNDDDNVEIVLVDDDLHVKLKCESFMFSRLYNAYVLYLSYKEED